MGPIIQQTQSPCSSCQGQGNSFDKSNRCQKCNGNKIFKENKKFDVNILHGSQNGETIPFLGEANQIVKSN
jgi:DnaJ-class molecular chaperone